MHNVTCHRQGVASLWHHYFGGCGLKSLGASAQLYTVKHLNALWAQFWTNQKSKICGGQSGDAVQQVWCVLSKECGRSWIYLFLQFLEEKQSDGLQNCCRVKQRKVAQLGQHFGSSCKVVASMVDFL